MSTAVDIYKKIKSKMTNLQYFDQFISLLESKIYENWSAKLPSSDWRKKLKDLPGLETEIGITSQKVPSIKWKKKTQKGSVFGIEMYMEKGKGVKLEMKSVIGDKEIGVAMSNIEKFLKANKIGIKSQKPVKQVENKKVWVCSIVVDEKDYEKLFQGVEKVGIKALPIK